MKISDFTLSTDNSEHALRETIEGFNNTRSDYPRDQTIHQIFAERAAATPEAVAIIARGREIRYRELWERANRLARLLCELGLEREAVVGIMLDRGDEAIVAMLGSLAAGCAYLPLSPDLPLQRLGYMLRESRAEVLISQKAYIREMGLLQWSCPSVSTTLCVDSKRVHDEIEPSGALMDPRWWAYVADETFDDISGGSWRSSYTGEWLSREAMDGYAENIRAKLLPFLKPDTRVLEVGCASGISMFRLAPLVGSYYATDLSPGIIQWTSGQVHARGIRNIELACLAAHEIDTIDAPPFDIIILNSVIECFPGYNYTRGVLEKCVNLLKDKGLLFLGNIWDLDRKAEFIESLDQFRREQKREREAFKVDRDDVLFVPRSYFEDLRQTLPAIESIEYSGYSAAHASELSRFNYDAMVFVDKRRERVSADASTKRQLDSRALAAQSSAPVEERTSAQGLAYIIFTSGTTGVPKGVMVEHRAVLRLVRGANYVELDASTRVLQTGSLAFDAATFEIWGPLLNGGSVCLPTGNSLLGVRELGRYLERWRVNTIFLTTSLFNQIVDADVTVFRGLKCLLCGGEKQSVRHINAVRSAHPDLTLINCYGPTENTTFTTTFTVDRPFVRDIPIGRPISNTTVYILTANRTLAAIGIPGELCAGGDGLARGYLEDPELTNERFIPHPFRPGERLYRTGDRARWTADGIVEFLGRIDDQIKLRGFRVEPAEIESVLASHPAVKEAVVILRRDNRSDKELVGYVSGDGIDVGELREHASSRLPGYMIPAHLIPLAKLPLGPTGKVSRADLPEPPRAVVATVSAGEAPRGDVERELAELWKQLLGVDRIGATDDFFVLGGHSLRVIQMVSRIETIFGVEVPLILAYKDPTLRGLAAFINDSKVLRDRGVELSRVDDAMFRLGGAPDARPILAFAPGSGYAFGYRDLADQLPDFAFYGLNFVEDDARFDDYARMIIDHGFSVPPVLFGYSGGGKLAYQVAVALERRGFPIAGLVLMDSARYLKPIEVDARELAEFADDYLSGVTSRVIREQAARKMSAYRRYLYGCVESIVIGSSIDVIEERDAPQTFHDEEGGLLGGTRLWQELTRSTFNVHQGAGEHRDMLAGPNLVNNARLLETIVRRLRAPE